MKYTYQVAGKEIELEQDPDIVAVRFREPAPHSMRAAATHRNGLGPFASRYEVPAEKFTLIPVSPTADARALRAERTMGSLDGDGEVDRAAPVFKMGEARVFASERVIVGFKDEPGDAPDLLAGFEAQVVSRIGNEFVVKLPERSDPLEVAAQLAKDDSVDYAEPDFVTVGRHVALRPATQRAEPQADVRNIDQYAVRITHAAEAWRFQVGNPGLIIAILDEGVDTRHEDLKTAVVAAYDGVDGDEFQEPNSWDGHGTACAGLAAAVHNHVGVKGIGGGCSLMAVRIAYSNKPGSDWTVANSWIQRGIEYAWTHGTAVLSNSWGGGAPSNAVINAFERARTQGRGGKGCVIVAAAGNSSGDVSFPADQANILAISASNEYDEFKTTTSRDGEYWWGSCFGPEVGIAAPGVHNWTTDITGSGGYSPTDYYDKFNGTSSATPIVAGCAGLMLSANPELTEREVREILCETADKVGHEPYQNGRNDQMGCGRLNVLRAVRAAAAGAEVELEGTVRQIGGKKAHAAAFYLESEGGATYLLKSHQGFEAVSLEVLEQQSLTYFEPFRNKKVRVRFARRQETRQGVILWGAQVCGDSASLSAPAVLGRRRRCA